MQTFLPYASFIESAACLDNKRLNKQILECKQILMALRGESGWSNHPAILMWKGYEDALSIYGDVCCWEYARRSRNGSHSYSQFFIDLADKHMLTIAGKAGFVYLNPIWLGYEPFHSMHRAVLLDKDPEWYGQFGWTEQPAKKVKNGSRMSYPYLWPSKMEIFKNN